MSLHSTDLAEMRSAAMTGVVTNLDTLRDKLRRALDEDPLDAADIGEIAEVARAAAMSGIEKLTAAPLREGRDYKASEVRDLRKVKDCGNDLAQIVLECQRTARRSMGMPDDWEAKRDAGQRAYDAKYSTGDHTADATKTRVTVRSEPGTYGPGSEHSYFGDLYKRTATGDAGATLRLQEHAMEIRTSAPAEYRASSGAAGSLDEFVPPLWLISNFVQLARPGRVTADLFTRMDLPPGTDSLNIPKITTGSSIGAQTSQNTTIANVDMVSGSVTAAVNTYAGYVDTSLQLLEQSPVRFDQVVFADLLAEHSKQIGLAVLAGTYANGQPEGVFTSTATNSVTYTATTATAAGVYTAVAKAAERVASQRFDAPTAIVMAPRRWLWLAQSTDTTGRPLVVPTGDSNQSVNSMAPAGDLNFGSAVGTMLGLPVYLDANVSTTYATNQDRIIVARFSDAHIYETGPKCEVFREPLSGSLGLRFRCYSYMATTGVRRFPASFSVVSGTGLADPPW